MCRYYFEVMESKYALQLKYFTLSNFKVIPFCATLNFHYTFFEKNVVVYFTDFIYLTAVVLQNTIVLVLALCTFHTGFLPLCILDCLGTIQDSEWKPAYKALPSITCQ